MSFDDLNYVDFIYLSLLVLFIIFFSLKGATKSINYSLKILLSVSIPFLFYKRSSNYILAELDIEFFNNLADSNKIFFEIVIFIILFLLIFFIVYCYTPPFSSSFMLFRVPLNLFVESTITWFKWFTHRPSSMLWNNDGIIKIKYPSWKSTDKNKFSDYGNEAMPCLGTKWMWNS